MVAQGSVPAPSRLEELAFQADLEPEELRALLYRLVDEGYRQLLAQVLREVEESSLQRVESQPYK